MNLESLGCRTDLITLESDVEILDRGDYIAVRSPIDPEHIWGNFLIFSKPPAAGDFENWSSLFDREIGTAPRINHKAYGWDTTDGDVGCIDPFLRAGFVLDESLVLTAESVFPPPRPNTEVSIRAITTDQEWEAVMANQIACAPPECLVANEVPV